MTETSRRTISLPAEHAAFVDAKVASGDYASASEVVREGLRSLRARDEAIEHWLRGDVAQSYDRMRDEPARGVPAENAFKLARQRWAK
jgi:antitoxin ParD1/3/4